ncbi:MAG: 50S ribosomal protein L22 [Nitrospiraceae bacterium]|nr:50S ribosomal protein L22 [Nitrospiraceae bacterium]MDA8326442.1 50S ribosomal protein L22 [Nitrospiraceae bacterium]
MQAKAILKYARLTPRKARRVALLVKGKKAAEALLELKFMPYRGAHYVEKALRSAIANADQKNADPEKMMIKSVEVGAGPSMKRMEPRSMGRANVRRKRSSHITVLLSDE